LLQDGLVRVQPGARENRSRPAIDALFRSAARAHRARVIGVLLSGQLSDGVMGLLAIRLQGGVTIVQDPAEAIYPSMPRTALEHGAADAVLPVQEIASTLVRLVNQPTAGETLMADLDDREAQTIE